MTWQPASLSYPDVELVLCELLRPHLTDVALTCQAPSEAGRVVQINRVGGRQDPPRDLAVVQMRCFDTTSRGAALLALLMVQTLPLLVTGDPIVNVRVSDGPTDLGDDPIPMRQLLLDVTTRGR